MGDRLAAVGDLWKDLARRGQRLRDAGDSGEEDR
jgi:hypothetical protein